MAGWGPVVGQYLYNAYINDPMARRFDRFVNAINPPTMNYRKGIGGQFQGRFGGKRHKPSGDKYTSGFAEKDIYANTWSMGHTLYIGFQSYPYTSNYSDVSIANNTPGRVFVDIWVAILRKYYKSYHVGRLEFMNPTQPLNSYVGGSEVWSILSERPDGNSSGAVQDTYTTVAADTLISLATQLAKICMSQFIRGKIPLRLVCQFGGTGMGGYMMLNQTYVTAKCTTVITVQNQTLADDINNNEGEANTTVDITANPLKGKLLYFSDLYPRFAAGYGNGDVEDEWGPRWLAPNSFDGGLVVAGSSNMLNVVRPYNGTSVQTPTGLWKAIPSPSTFSNLSAVQDIGMEPGVQKTFKLKFRFNGTLANFMKHDRTVFSASPLQLFSGEYSYGMGTSVYLVLEKRIRRATNPISIGYQVETNIKTGCYTKHQTMTKLVTCNID